MSARTASSDPGAARLEPFLVVSLLLHAAALALGSTILLGAPAYVPLSQGGIVQVIPVPIPQQPSTPAPAITATPAPKPSAPGGAGETVKKPTPRSAAEVVSEKPKPKSSPSPPKVTRPAGPAPAPPAPPKAEAPSAAQDAHRVLTSERSPVSAPLAAESRREPAGASPTVKVGEGDERAAGPLTRPEGTGTGGVRATTEPAGPPEGELSAMLIQSTTAPVYPKNALTRQLEGKLLLSVSIRPDGSLGGVTVQQGSGFPELDNVAVPYVRDNWRFRPSATGRPYVLTFEVAFILARDEQGRASPQVAVRAVDERATYTGGST